jgi:hypothetical protein
MPEALGPLDCGGFRSAWISKPQYKRILLANELYLIVTVIFSEMSGGLNG